MIVVGIYYGSDRFAEGNYRASDFTAAAEDRDYWGKAPVFQAVMANELMPMIEMQYPSAPSKRILLGQSLAGQFVLYSALTRPELFWGHIASNPALHRNLDFFLQWRGEGEMPLEATRLFVSESDKDAPELRQPAMQWIAAWSPAERSKPFVLQVYEPVDESHMSAITEAFRKGLLWLFAAPETP